MKSMKIILFQAVLAFVVLVPLSKGATFDPAEIKQQIKSIAHANDFTPGDDKSQQIEYLRSHSNELFPLFVELLSESQDDWVRASTLAFAANAGESKQMELKQIAVQMLSSRDADSYPRTIAEAMTLLRVVGDQEQVALVEKFASHPSLLIRTAAKKTLIELNSRKTSSQASNTSINKTSMGAQFATSDKVNDANPVALSKSQAGPIEPSLDSKSTMIFTWNDIWPWAIGGALLLALIAFLFRKSK